MHAWLRRLPFPTSLLFPRGAAPADRRQDPAATTPDLPTAPGRAVQAADPQIVRANFPELEAARAAALRQMFPKLYSWCANRLEWSRALEVHAYLSEATSVAELERRIRALEHRRSFVP